VISPDGCAQIRPIWRLFGGRTRTHMHVMPKSGRCVSTCSFEMATSGDGAGRRIAADSGGVREPDFINLASPWRPGCSARHGF
jgi:hypothetical protein